MEIKDIAVDVENMEEVRGGQLVNIAQAIGPRLQANAAANVMGDSVGGTQQLSQYNKDMSTNSNSANVGQNYETHSLFSASNSIFKSGFWGGRFD